MNRVSFTTELAIRSAIRARYSLAEIVESRGVSKPTIIARRREMNLEGEDHRCECGKEVFHSGRCPATFKREEPTRSRPSHALSLPWTPISPPTKAQLMARR